MNLFRTVEHFFRFKAHKTTFRTEVVAGLTTWMTMVYIVIVNPDLLSSAGLDKGAVFVATCVAATVGSLIMAILTNYPIALAPGMGLNAFFAFSIVLGVGYDWPTALGAVFYSGVLFFLLSVTKARAYIINAIPQSIKIGIAVGIGLFLAVIGMQNSGIVVQGEGTLLDLGNVKGTPFILSVIGFIVILALHVLRKSWCVLAGIGLVTALSWIFDDASSFQGLVSLPPDVSPTFLKLNLNVPLDLSFLSIVLTLLLVDLFDTSGALIAIGKVGRFEKSGKIPRMRGAMAADSLSTIVGSLMGTSTTTSYIESNAGISVGGRTGFTSVIVALLFVLTLFFFPLVLSFPIYASAPALLYVAIFLMAIIREFDLWKDFSEAAPLVVTALFMPLTFSIADGLAFGVLTYVFVKILSGRFREIHPAMLILAVIFLLNFLVL